jgi:hypothetical protein
VLYLCGPEPRNDLEVLLSLGVDPQNVWAIESDKSLYDAAVKQLVEDELYIRVHHGSLETFFEMTNEIFDIVYIDACGPLPGGRPSTIRAPYLMHCYERLAPLGALITNYTQPGAEKHDEYRRILTHYFSLRYNDIPGPLWQTSMDPASAQYDFDELYRHTDEYFDCLYSDFVTRFLVDIGRSILPGARIYANPDVRRKYFAGNTEIREAVLAAVQVHEARREGETPDAFLRRLFLEIGDTLLNPSSYPVLSFLRRVKSDPSLRPMFEPLLNHKIHSETIEDAFERSELLASILEGHVRIASPEMVAALRESWFDRRGGCFCDVPLPHLLINTLFGVYGRPTFPNPRQSARYTYIRQYQGL